MVSTQLLIIRRGKQFIKYLLMQLIKTVHQIVRNNYSTVLTKIENNNTVASRTLSDTSVH